MNYETEIGAVAVVVAANVAIAVAITATVNQGRSFQYLYTCMTPTRPCCLRLSIMDRRRHLVRPRLDVNWANLTSEAEIWDFVSLRTARSSSRRRMSTICKRFRTYD